MKFTIGTASSNMNFEEDLKLIKSSLLYADSIELIGMAEYAIFNYLPRCFDDAKDLDSMLKSFVPFLKAFDNDETRTLVEKMNDLNDALAPYMPYLKKKSKRNKQEILAQIQFQKMEKQIVDLLEKTKADLLDKDGIREIQSLCERNIISIYDYSYNGFSIDELTGGYFANLLGMIKHGGSYPLFDSISADVLSSVVNTQILDFSKTDKEIIRHAGVANSILATLPTLEKASIDEILDFKKSMKQPLDNFRTAIYKFSEQIISMPWDDDFKYECIKLYDTEVVPKVNEINALSSETSVLKNFGMRVLADEDERRKLGYVGAGLITTITTESNIVDALGILENYLRRGAKIGLTAVGVAAFLKTADILKQAHVDVKNKKSEIEGNVMYYYYRASKKF